MRTGICVWLLAALLGLGALAGAVYTNDTGAIAYGFRISFQAPVVITSHAPVFPEQDPQGEATTFVFSGGKVPPGGNFWLSWRPTIVRVVAIHWMASLSDLEVDETKMPRRLSDCQGWVPSASSISGDPGTLQEIWRILYGYLEEPRHCTGAYGFEIPVYVSIPYLTPRTDMFELELEDGSRVPLVRIDEVNLVGNVSVEEIPWKSRLRILRNQQTVVAEFDVEITNGFQAITVGLCCLEDVLHCAPLREDIMRAATPQDCWGTHIVGGFGEGSFVHTKDFFPSVCHRLADLRITDIYVTSFLNFEEIEPFPKIGLQPPSGAGAISESELVDLVRVAHDYGLRFHLRYGARSDFLDMTYLTRGTKTEAWVTSLLESYKQVIVEQAAMAERCGVDALMLNWGGEGVLCYGGYRRAWGEGWYKIIREVQQVFSGELEYLVAIGCQYEDLITRRLSPEYFEGVNAIIVPIHLFIFRNRNVRSSDSISYLYHKFSTDLRELAQFRRATGKRVYLDVGFQSYDGYIAKGGISIFEGQFENAEPDFFEQARAYEAFFQVVQRERVVDGVICWGYQWGDPFGPDLVVGSIGHYDLHASVRNKPAEAVVKKWFEGKPGPSPCGEVPNCIAPLPWCSGEEYECSNKPPCTLNPIMISDFNTFPFQSTFGGRFDFESHEIVHPGTDPESYCEICQEVSESGDGHLKANYRHNSYMLIGLFGLGRDLSMFEGFGFTIWADRRTSVRVGIGVVYKNKYFGYFVLVPVDILPRRYEIPFADFWHGWEHAQGISLEHLANVAEILFSVPEGEGSLYFDDWYFYNADR